jgi:hypothetical protein
LVGLVDDFTFTMTTHNIVVFGGDHCGPEVCSIFAVRVNSQLGVCG